MRKKVEDIIETLIALLDEIDGDPDLEHEPDEHDAQPPQLSTQDRQPARVVRR